ncbi:hypothetical protein P872_20705 [Rhodonellum psychrophilum GCM71 = DSM 17998]|uniref:Uncharacterized protein n=1 Tax=Rhodonellum psychrophilum GCM71 = DSM 17998 TaxID=1123057 RepID=U5BUD2_9BACT|nr:hypothetical protein P872_20705 [Rhodonellum psychrophilum GCM71 = DSM 17998]
MVINENQMTNLLRLANRIDFLIVISAGFPVVFMIYAKIGVSAH